VDHFHYKNGVYHAEDVSLVALAEQIGTPFYCYSTATLTRHYKVFSEHFSDIGAKVCYAVKTNGNVAVLKTLAKLGSGADVVSEGEIRLALAAGIKASDIVFSGVGKTAQEMAYALDCDIFQFNVESEPELQLLNEVAKAKGKKAKVAIRINPDVDPRTHAKISTGQKETKFGIAMGHAPAVYTLAAALPHIELQGVSVHIGSQLTSIEPFMKAFAIVRDFVLKLKAQGIVIKTIDLGGGLGIPYGKDEPPLPDSYAQTAKREMHGLGCQLIFEPGRMLVGNAGVLVSRVIYVKKSESKTFLIIDAGMNDLIRPTLYDAYHEIVPVKEPKDAKTTPMDVVGPVCETGDIFAEGRSLPPMQAGDLVAFRSAGAYGASMAGTYNARLLVPEVMVNGSKHAIVRQRQTYDELIARDIIPSWL
jgi:diaminopimelate decarboxylase